MLLMLLSLALASQATSLSGAFLPNQNHTPHLQSLSSSIKTFEEIAETILYDSLQLLHSNPLLHSFKESQLYSHWHGLYLFLLAENTLEVLRECNDMIGDAKNGLTALYTIELTILARQSVNLSENLREVNERQREPLLKVSVHSSKSSQDELMFVKPMHMIEDAHLIAKRYPGAAITCICCFRPECLAKNKDGVPKMVYAIITNQENLFRDCISRYLPLMPCCHGRGNLRAFAYTGGGDLVEALDWNLEQRSIREMFTRYVHREEDPILQIVLK